MASHCRLGYSRHWTVLLDRPARDDGAARRADAARDARSFARRADAACDARSCARRADAARDARSFARRADAARDARSFARRADAARDARSFARRADAARDARSFARSRRRRLRRPLLRPSRRRRPLLRPLAQAAAVAPATEPPRLELNNEDGVVHVTGAVHDEGAKVSILDALKSVFGADKVQGDITVDANRDPAPWLAKLSDALASLKTGGVEAVFDGNSVNVGGAIGDADRDRIIAALKSALGDSLSFGVLRDHAADPSSANDKATNELTSLQPGFAPKDLIATLNKSIVNFPSDSAEVPASMDAFLRSAATGLKQLRAGHVIEIAGYTDNTGDPALNVALSQKRAEAVRDALIKDGADPAMLIAKGYGSADPIASNDTPEGRLRNRRIEYRVVKTP